MPLKHGDNTFRDIGQADPAPTITPSATSLLSSLVPLRQGDNCNADTSVYPYDCSHTKVISKTNRHGVEQQRVSVPIEELEQKCLSVCAIRCR